MVYSLLIYSAIIETGVVTTVLGFGTVFVVLCLIYLVIAIFGFVMKHFNKTEPVNNAPVILNPVSEEKQEKPKPITDDTELIAVITAAIAASMGRNITPDKLVVRSLKRVKKSNWKTESIYEQQINNFKC